MRNNKKNQTQIAMNKNKLVLKESLEEAGLTVRGIHTVWTQTQTTHHCFWRWLWQRWQSGSSTN